MFMCHIGNDKLDMPYWAHNFSYVAVSTIFGALIYVQRISGVLHSEEIVSSGILYTFHYHFAHAIVAFSHCLYLHELVG